MKLSGLFVLFEFSKNGDCQGILLGGNNSEEERIIISGLKRVLKDVYWNSGPNNNHENPDQGKGDQND